MPTCVCVRMGIMYQIKGIHCLHAGASSIHENGMILIALAEEFEKCCSIRCKEEGSEREGREREGERERGRERGREEGGREERVRLEREGRGREGGWEGG